jgi:hypothetical protein
MPCKICTSANLQNLTGELTASFPGVNNLNISPLYLCQEILVCLDCGFAELHVPPAALQQLVRAKQIDK